MTLPFYIVDVFAEQKYAGNQLAVFTDAQSLSTEQMQQIAREINFAESTFITALNQDTGTASVRIFTPDQEMKFAGHPIIGTSWILMHKIFQKNFDAITLEVPVGAIAVQQKGDLVWLQAAQPSFLNSFSATDFENFSNLNAADFDTNFAIQEVTTGSAFVIIPLKSAEALQRLQLDKQKAHEWLVANCGTAHHAFYFFTLEGNKLESRMLCIEDNQLKEDAATGSASTCLQAFLLKYYQQEIQITNHQGDYMNRPSRIYFDGKKEAEHFEIKIGGKTQYVAKGEWEV